MNDLSTTCCITSPHWENISLIISSFMTKYERCLNGYSNESIGNGQYHHPYMDGLQVNTPCYDMETTRRLLMMTTLAVSSLVWFIKWVLWNRWVCLPGIVAIVANNRNMTNNVTIYQLKINRNSLTLIYSHPPNCTIWHDKNIGIAGIKFNFFLIKNSFFTCTLPVKLKLRLSSFHWYIIWVHS